MTKDKLAVIETGGKQYLVKPGNIIQVERIEKPAKGDSVYFGNVFLLITGEKIEIGNPYIKTAKIEGKYLEEKKGKKITNLRYHSKTRHAIKKGHRQIYSEVKIGDF